ncbi:MAG TPA: HAD-IA family hydrolase, partial [Polyangiaceae bacterium]
GVLVRIGRTWTEVCSAAGFEVRGDVASHRAQMARHELMELYALGRMSEDEWATRSAAALGGVYTAEELKTIHHAWLVEEYPGVVAVIDGLHEAGLHTACLSNTNHAHWTRMLHHDGTGPLAGEPRYPGIVRLRSHYASHLLGLAKPDEAIYRAFERASGYGGDEILFFDDLPANVEAARKIGWTAERIDPDVDTAPQLHEHLRRRRVL